MPKVPREVMQKINNLFVEARQKLQVLHREQRNSIEKAVKERDEKKIEEIRKHVADL